MISVILIEPEWASNVGAVARAIANFGFSELVLINPKCNKDDFEAIKRAKHSAKPILENAKIKKMDYLKKFDYLIATTSKLGNDYNISRTPLIPEQLSKRLSEIDTKSKNIGLVFGREGDGLYNEEIKMCDFIVTIPTSKDYSAMNLSHAVAIVLYELAKIDFTARIESNFRPIGHAEKINLIKKIDKIVEGMRFGTEDKKETQKLLWRRIIGKSFLSRREAFALFGFFRKIK